MSLYDAYKTDSKCESEGVWYITNLAPEAEFRIARAGGNNVAFQMAADKYATKYKKLLDLNRLPVDTALKAVIDLYAESIILDWRGVKDEDGLELACTFENKVKIMTDLPDLFKEIQDVAGDMEAYRAYLDDQDSKNLPSVSSTA